MQLTAASSFPSGTLAQRGLTTVADFFAEYRALVEADLSSNAIAAYDRAWRLRVAPSLGHVAVSDVRPIMVLRAQAEWDGADSTKQDALALLSRLLGLAVLDGLLGANPCRNLPRSRRKAQEADLTGRALTPAQVERMLELTARHPFGQRAVAGLVFTGLRLGELAGLRWEDVDTNDGLLTVRRTFSPDGHGRMEERATKSGRIRMVPIIDELLPWLDAGRSAGFDHVFTGVRGGPWDSGNLSRALDWPRIRDQIATFPAGEALHFHDLRHTFLTRLADFGVSPQKLQKVAGHSSVTMTEHYTRSSSRDAALEVRDLVNARTREVILRGGESAANSAPGLGS